MKNINNENNIVDRGGRGSNKRPAEMLLCDDLNVVANKLASYGVPFKINGISVPSTLSRTAGTITMMHRDIQALKKSNSKKNVLNATLVAKSISDEILISDLSNQLKDATSHVSEKNVEIENLKMQMSQMISKLESFDSMCMNNGARHSLYHKTDFEREVRNIITNGKFTIGDDS